MCTSEQRVDGHKIATDRERDHCQREHEEFCNDRAGMVRKIFVWAGVGGTYVGTAGEMFDFVSDLVSSWSKCVFSSVVIL